MLILTSNNPDQGKIEQKFLKLFPKCHRKNNVWELCCHTALSTSLHTLELILFDYQQLGDTQRRENSVMN